MIRSAHHERPVDADNQLWAVGASLLFRTGGVVVQNRIHVQSRPVVLCTPGGVIWIHRGGFTVGEAPTDP
eukprot:6575264-Prymnesium_polylepis.2